MSTYEGNRLDRATAERLLNGDWVAAGTGQPRLAALLADAAAPPARPARLPGEAAALAAFQAAHRDPVPQPRRFSMLKTSLAKLLTVKVGVACAAVLGFGGVAVAASSGSLPGPLHHLGLGASPSGSHSPHPRPSGGPTAWPSGWPSAWPGHTPPPGLVALCRKYSGQDNDHRGRALDQPGFGDLVKRAGAKDRDRVDRFCDFVLHGGPNGWPSGFPTVHPSWPRPSGEPTGEPAPRPHPTGYPTDHPTGTPPTRNGH
ncbi:MAG TPA: hypothetical protein VJT31_22960 [Rugosimonospora sp.]|nr:hypothetical protein [Rugosimonospora sp.]